MGATMARRRLKAAKKKKAAALQEKQNPVSQDQAVAAKSKPQSKAK